MNIFILLLLTGATWAELTGPAWGQVKASERDWNNVLSAAKKEGTVAVISGAGGGETRKSLTEPFQKKYGITVDYLPAGGGQIVPKVRAERSAGQFLWDIFIGHPSTPIRGLKPIGALDAVEPSLILPEVRDGKNWLGGELEYADKERTIFIMLSYTRSHIYINTNLVKAEEFKSVRDLLNPKWKGKILAGDPQVPGPGLGTFHFMYAHKELGPDFIRKIAQQDLHFLRDDRQAVEWLAMGKYPVLVGASETDLEPFMRQKLPVGVIDPRQMKEGGSLSPGPGAVMLFTRPAHSNAAKVYLNWLLSREGQAEFVKAVGYPSRRVDGPRPTEPWKFPPDPRNYRDYDEVGVALRAEQVVPFLKEVFKE